MRNKSGSNNARAPNYSVHWFRVLGATVGLSVLAGLLWQLNLSLSWKLIYGLGFWSLVLLLPFGLAMAVDTIVWHNLLKRTHPAPAWSSLFAIRLSTEAALVSLAGGAIVAEGLAPYLLKKSWNIPVSASLASVAARKLFIVFSQGFYIFVGVLLAFPFLQNISATILGQPGLELLVLAFGVIIGLAGAIGTLFASGGQLAQKLHRALQKIPTKILKRWVNRLEEGFVSTDSHLQNTLGQQSKHWLMPLTGMFVVWMFEAFETWLIFHFLGVELSFLQVWAVEPALSLIRHLVFFVPAGLGFQDMGYILVLQAQHTPNAAEIGAAFIILKRTKELIWVVIGYCILPFLVKTNKTSPIFKDNT